MRKVNLRLLAELATAKERNLFRVKQILMNLSGKDYCAYHVLDSRGRIYNRTLDAEYMNGNY